MWYETASEDELREAVRKAVGFLKLGPCNKTSKECPGCTQEWITAASYLMFGHPNGGDGSCC